MSATHVELKTAYHWHCEECGEENFALPQKAELTDEDRESAYREFHDLEDFATLPAEWRQFEMVWIPHSVTCKSCAFTYATMDETSGE